MPLLDALDPKQKQHLELRGLFDELPSTDQMNVVELVKMGKSSVAAADVEADIELSEEGKQFIQHPFFREIYDRNVNREPPPPDNSPEMSPVVRGLLEVIKHLKGGEGMLKPDNSNRVGGGEEKSSDGEPTGFEDELSTAFKEGGPRGLAFAHRELLRDPKYNKFLKGVK